MYFNHGFGVYYICIISEKYVPVKSKSYSIKNDDLIYETKNFKLIISARLDRAYVYKQFTRLLVTIMSKVNCLDFNLESVRMVPYKKIQKKYFDSSSRKRTIAGFEFICRKW